MPACGTRTRVSRHRSFTCGIRENDRSKLPENRRRLDELLHSQRVRARQGLDRYLQQSYTATG